MQERFRLVSSSPRWKGRIRIFNFLRDICKLKDDVVRDPTWQHLIGQETYPLADVYFKTPVT